MKYIAYILSMPNKGSWDGKWTGEKNLYARVQKISDKYFDSCKTKEKELVGKSFYYSWDDGWTARIEVKQVTEQEAKSLKKRSVGFYGYDWMIYSLIHNGEIRYEENWQTPLHL